MDKGRKLIKHWKKTGDLPSDYPEPPSTLHETYSKIGNARRGLRKIRTNLEKRGVIKHEQKVQQHVLRTGELTELTERRIKARDIDAAANRRYAITRATDTASLAAAREVQRARRQAEFSYRREQLQPVRSAAAATGRAARRGALYTITGTKNIARVLAPPAGLAMQIGQAALKRLGEAGQRVYAPPAYRSAPPVYQPKPPPKADFSRIELGKIELGKINLM